MIVLSPFIATVKHEDYTGKSVLIVEDEKTMAQAVGLKLNKLGIHTDTVGTGTECIEAIKNHAYDVVLLDIIMPEMDGWAVLKKIKELGLKVKVIVTSNLSQEEDYQRAKQMGAEDYLVKSNVTLANVANKVMRYL